MTLRPVTAAASAEENDDKAMLENKATGAGPSQRQQVEVQIGAPARRPPDRMRKQKQDYTRVREVHRGNQGRPKEAGIAVGRVAQETDGNGRAVQEGHRNNGEQTFHSNAMKLE